MCTNWPRLSGQWCMKNCATSARAGRRICPFRKVQEPQRRRRQVRQLDWWSGRREARQWWEDRRQEHNATHVDSSDTGQDSAHKQR